MYIMLCYPNKLITIHVISSIFYILYQVKVTQKTLDELLTFLIEFCNECRDWSVSDSLRALGAILYGRGASCLKVNYCSSGQIIIKSINL